MKKKVLCFLIFVLPAFMVTLASDASQGYLLIPDDSRKIAVSEYKDAGKQTRFYYQGGEITIGKQAVEDIMDVELKRSRNQINKSEYKEEPVETAQVVEDESKTTFPDLMEELAKVYREKEALTKEREKLMEKKEELDREIEQEGTRIPSAKKNELQRRLEALEEEINRFNEKVAETEEKEKAIKSKMESLEKAE